MHVASFIVLSLINCSLCGSTLDARPSVNKKAIGNECFYNIYIAIPFETGLMLE